MPPVQIQNRPPTNFSPNDGPVAQQPDPRLAAMVSRQRAAFRRAQLRTGMLAKNDVSENRLPGTQAPPIARNAQSDLTPQEGMAESSTTREVRKSRQQDKNDNKKPHLTYFDALRTHPHEWHNRDWWKQHCNTIVFVTGGYYFLDAGYWYPAWGYDPYNSYYDYDGPIYTYGNLLPDQVIANVQAALQDGGYYFGAVTGSLSVETRTALVNFQRDQGLTVTGAIDEPTVVALGL